MKSKNSTIKFGTVEGVFRSERLTSYYAELDNSAIASIKDNGFVLLNSEAHGSKIKGKQIHRATFGIEFKHEGKGIMSELFKFYQKKIKNQPIIASCKLSNQSMINFFKRNKFELCLLDMSKGIVTYCKNIKLPIAYSATAFIAYDGSIVTLDETSSNPLYESRPKELTATRTFGATDYYLKRGDDYKSVKKMELLKKNEEDFKLACFIKKCELKNKIQLKLLTNKIKESIKKQEKAFQALKLKTQDDILTYLNS